MHFLLKMGIFQYHVVFTGVLPWQEKQLGRGVSKQAARSFPRLLRRLAPADARRALAKMLTADPSR